MTLIRARLVRWLWSTALCVMAIAMIPIESRNEILSLAEASIPETLSIPSQILRAKMPSSKPNSLKQQEQQLWLYEGALYDPLDGRKVAKVRGLELVQPLKDTSHLSIDALLKHPNATYQDSKTIWSQKIFCYTTTKDVDMASSDDKVEGLTPPRTQESILDSVRVRQRSPRKEVPLDQAVAVYETATTFVSRKSKENSSANSKKSGDEIEVLVHSEWPNGQTIWGTARDCSQQNEPPATSNSGGSSSIDFTIFAKLRNRNSRLYSPDLIRDESSQDETRTTKSGDIIVSPKRASLVQFGSSDGTMESKHKFGARETYSYRNIPKTTNNENRNWQKWRFAVPWKRPKANDASSETNPTVYYTRYGEGPPFYAPGRMCMLELRGKPVSNLGEVGPLLRRLIQGDGNAKQQYRTPPISNFHWKEEEGTNEEIATSRDRKRKQKGAAGLISGDSNNPSTMSIQSAWNLKERNRELQSKSAATQLQKRRHRTKQPLALKLDVPDDTTMETTNGKRKWRVLVKKGRNCAMTIWDRIKASSTLESRS